jgi:hypothetical protein
MPSTAPQYRLVIFDAIDDPTELRDMISAATGIHPTDAVQWLARAPGVWPRPLDEATVRRVLDGLFESRVAAEAWRSDLFPELSPARTFHRAACLDEGLRIEGLRGEPTHWVPWDRVEMICAGKVVGEDEFREGQRSRWPSGVVAGIRTLTLRKAFPAGRASRAQRSPRDPLGEVLIVRRDPRIAFRVVENQMNYAYLGERLKNSAAENFPIFLHELCARAQHAYLPPSTRAMIETGDPAQYEFPSSQAILDYATHRLLWSWYRRDGEAEKNRPDDETTEHDPQDLE